MPYKVAKAHIDAIRKFESLLEEIENDIQNELDSIDSDEAEDEWNDTEEWRQQFEDAKNALEILTERPKGEK